MRRCRNYFSGFFINQVTGPDGVDWSNNSWFLIMCRDINNLDFWMLIKQEPDKSGWVVGYGPDEFVDFIVKDKKDFPIEETIISTVKSPGKWRKLMVLVN